MARRTLAPVALLLLSSLFGCTSERVVYVERGGSLLSSCDTDAMADAGTAADVAVPDAPAVDALAVDVASDAPSPCPDFNGGAGCSSTEQLFANVSADCYTCLVNGACLDDVLYADQGSECEDVAGSAAAGASAGQSRASLCLAVLSCALSSHCVSPRGQAGDCYCGTLLDSCTSASNAALANGACAQAMVAGVEVPASSAPSTVCSDLVSRATGGGQAFYLLSCASTAGCASACGL